MNLIGSWELEEPNKKWPLVSFPFSLAVNGTDKLVIHCTADSTLEEIFIGIIKGTSSRKYANYLQRGKLNFQKKRLFSIVTSSDRQFEEFSVLHIGPNLDQRITEKFILNETKDAMIVEINVTVHDNREEGQVLTFFKRFKRADTDSHKHIKKSNMNEFRPIFNHYILGTIASSHSSSTEYIKASKVSITDTIESSVSAMFRDHEGSGSINTATNRSYKYFQTNNHHII
jgi:hypothetical protein